MTAPTPLIAVAELAQLRLSDRPPVVLDVRWRLDEPDGLPAFRESHLPDAVYVSLDDELARHGDPGEGRHPLPDPGAFQASARRWGIDDGDTVVVYDDWRSIAASRAWWLLRHAGHADLGQSPADPDVLAVPDPASYTKLPWKPGVAVLHEGAWMDLDSNGVDRSGNPDFLTLDEPSPAGAFAYNTVLVDIAKSDLIHRPGWDQLSTARSHVFRRDL